MAGAGWLKYSLCTGLGRQGWEECVFRQGTACAETSVLCEVAAALQPGTKELLGQGNDYEKILKLTADAKFAKHSVDGGSLSSEVQQLGLPKEVQRNLVPAAVNPDVMTFLPALFDVLVLAAVFGQGLTLSPRLECSGIMIAAQCSLYFLSSSNAPTPAS
ncbi:uncharacterized protein [Macaca nemestrina]|uniref:uncharacterized protein isoform X3 n=1 Tax=Macaca nemestrina TaxID=9545 RepID=UPI0039B9C43D